MKKRYLIYMILMVISLPLNIQSHNYTYEVKKIIRVQYDLAPATSRYVVRDGKRVPVAVFKYNPIKEIKAKLIKAGFEVVSQNSSKFDLSLKVSHKERVRLMNRYPGDNTQKTMIDHIGFVVEDKNNKILLKVDRGPFSSYTSMDDVKQSFINDLVELLQIRSEKDNETACWLEFVSRRGDQAGLEAIEKAGDNNYPLRDEQIAVFKPMLRNPDLTSRMLACRLLDSLAFIPADENEKAVLSMVKSYPYQRWSAQSAESTTGAWAARQGVISIIKFGTTAIDLLVEDLKGKEDINTQRYGVSDGGVAPRAKAVLKRLSAEQWTKFTYAKFSSIGRNVEFVEHEAEADFFKVKYFDFRNKLMGEVEVVNPKKATEAYAKVWNEEWNDYTTGQLMDVLKNGKHLHADKNALIKVGIHNPNYYRDLLEILGEIADRSINPSLETLLSNPKLQADVQKAIEKINKREQETTD